MHTRPAIRRSLMFATVAVVATTLSATPTHALIPHTFQTDASCISRATSWMSSTAKRNDSVDLWVPADGVGLYSLDTQQWLEPDGFDVFDIYVDPQLGIKLCFHFEDNRGAASVSDQNDRDLGTVYADDPLAYGIKCITFDEEALEQTLDVVSWHDNDIELTTSYDEPRSIPEIPSHIAFLLTQSAADGSTLTQLRVRRAPAYASADMTLVTDETHIIWLHEDGQTEYIEGRVIDVDVGDAWYLNLCLDQVCDDPYVLSEDMSIVKHRSGFVPTPQPATHSTTIRPIKTCPSILSQNYVSLPAYSPPIL